jgi:hypothetical protein
MTRSMNVKAVILAIIASIQVIVPVWGYPPPQRHPVYVRQMGTDPAGGGRVDPGQEHTGILKDNRQ